MVGVKMSKMLSKMNLISVVQQLPKEDIETIQGYVEMIEDENEKLKKQYEKVLNDYCRLDAYNRTKQKEFIKYMNNCIKVLEKGSSNKLQNTINLGIIDVTKTILQKYKSVIGVSDEIN